LIPLSCSASQGNLKGLEGREEEQEWQEECKQDGKWAGIVSPAPNEVSSPFELLEPFEFLRPMTSRFQQFPKALAEKSRSVMLPGGIPALLAHPDWTTPAPTMIWLHGRTATKELDPGRYLRWIRAGIAACAIDLPGHGERFDADLQSPGRSLEMVARAVKEIDSVAAALAGAEFGGVFDVGRLGLGGMSAGGMVALRRLCEAHTFRCAAVEATTGWLAALYHPELVGLEARARHRWSAQHPREAIVAVDPMEHLATWRAIPLLALHSEADAVVPLAGMRAFLDELRAHYEDLRASADRVELRTWANTGAPEEHVGFGRASNDAKNLQTEFLGRWLRNLGAA
jgi:dienelactone hydrolase